MQCSSLRQTVRRMFLEMFDASELEQMYGGDFDYNTGKLKHGDIHSFLTDTQGWQHMGRDDHENEYYRPSHGPHSIHVQRSGRWVMKKGGVHGPGVVTQGSGVGDLVRHFRQTGGM